SFAFIDLGQDETRVAGRGRVEIHRVRELRRLGHVVAQESFLSGTVVRRLHPRPVAVKEAVALRRLIGRGNDDERKLNLVVISHSWFSEFKSSVCASRKKGSPLGKPTPVKALYRARSEASERFNGGNGLVASIHSKDTLPVGGFQRQA